MSDPLITVTQEMVQAALDLIQKVKLHKSYTVGDRTYTARNMAELWDHFYKLRAEYNSQAARENIAAGLGSGRKSFVRFGG